MHKFLAVFVVTALLVTELFAGGGAAAKSSGPAKLTIFLETHPAIIDFNTNKATLWAEEKLGVDLDFNVAPQGSGQERMNLLLNSRNYPDIWYMTVPDENAYGIDSGILLELTDVIKNYMPNLAKTLADIPIVAQGMRALDGKYYHTPSYNVCVHCEFPFKMWYNTMQLGKLNLEPPKTADEFYNALVKYRQANPDGIPLSGDMEYIVPFLTNMYTYYPAGFCNEYGLILNGGKVSTMLNSEGYRNALAYMNKLYREKLLYEGTFTMDYNQVRALINSPGEPVLFMGQMHNVVYVDGNQSPELYTHERALAPLAGPDGSRYVSFQPTDTTPAGAISSSCKNVEKAAAFLDLFYNHMDRQIMLSGIQGVHWDTADPGAVAIDGKSPAGWKRLVEYTLAPQDFSWTPLASGIDLSLLQGDRNPDYNNPLFGAQLRQFETVEKYSPAYQDTYQSLPLLKFSSDETETLSTLQVSLENYIKQMRVAFITGERNLSGDWDAYAWGLESQGMSQLVGYYQTAYDRVK